MIDCLILCFVAAYLVGRYSFPGKPVREQFTLGLQFIVGQLSLVVIAGAIVLAVWMVLQ